MSKLYSEAALAEIHSPKYPVPRSIYAGLHPEQGHSDLEYNRSDLEDPKYPVSRSTSLNHKEVVYESSARETDHQGRQSRSSMLLRKRVILPALITVLVLGLVIVLVTLYEGHVIGPKPASSPTSTSIPVPSGSPRIADSILARSVSGAWNGTGIAAFTSGLPAFFGFVIYQDYTGTLKEARWTYDEVDGSVQLLNTRDVKNIKAAQGTSLTGATYYIDATTYHYQVVYVNDQGILSDMWRHNRSNIDEDWQTGDLSSLEFESAPLTWSRPALGLVYDGHVNSTTSKSPNSTRIWAGGADGYLHQLATSWGNWSSMPQASYTLPDSWAWGGAAGAYGYGGDGTPNTTVYNTLAHGELQLHSSIDGNSADQRANWPQGSWINPVDVSTLQAAPNSSVVAWWDTYCPLKTVNGTCDSYLLYPGTDGFLRRTVLDSSTDEASQVNLEDNTFVRQRILPGTDLAAARATNTSVIFHQFNGSDIQWLALYDNGTWLNHDALAISQ